MTSFPSISIASSILAGLPGGWEWLIVLFIILLLFGRRLPGVARSLGQGISSFKKGLAEPVDEDESSGGKKDPYARRTPERKAAADEPAGNDV